MENLASIINISFVLSGLMLCIICGLGLVIMSQVSRYTVRLVTHILVSLAAYLISCAVSLILRGRPGEIVHIVLIISVYLEFALGEWLVTLESLYLISIVEKEDRYRGMRNFLIIWFVLELFILTASQTSDFYYTIGADNIYRRTPGTYWISTGLVLIVLEFDVVLYLVNWRMFTRGQRITFSFYLFFPIAAFLLALFFYELHIPIILSVVCTMALLLYIFIDQTERFAEKQRENEEMRRAVMLSQIQPHFLFNSLGAIRELCRVDPPKAEEAVVRFSQYLRANMDSLQSNVPIPFADELAHTQDYLELEQMRFGDKLQVKYDIGATEFRLPALGLQPIVENAVRHGIRKKVSGSGSIMIRSRDEKKEWVVEVEDDGPGFDPSAPLPADGRSHVGLQSVRARLEQMCGGRLEVASAPGEGTLVRICIPKH